jgi:hypothetical protein
VHLLLLTQLMTATHLAEFRSLLLQPHQLRIQAVADANARHRHSTGVDAVLVQAHHCAPKAKVTHK